MAPISAAPGSVSGSIRAIDSAGGCAGGCGPAGSAIMRTVSAVMPPLRLIRTAPLGLSVSPRIDARRAVRSSDGVPFDSAVRRASASRVMPSAACTMSAWPLPATTAIAPRRNSAVARSTDCSVTGSGIVRCLPVLAGFDCVVIGAELLEIVVGMPVITGLYMPFNHEDRLRDRRLTAKFLPATTPYPRSNVNAFERFKQACNPLFCAVNEAI